MSYPKDLEDYSDAELLNELDRRKRSREDGNCDYCGGSDPRKKCGQSARHTQGTHPKATRTLTNPIMEKADEVLPPPAVPAVIRRRQRLPRLGQ